MIVPVLTFVILFTGICTAYWVFVVRPEEQAVGAIKGRLKRQHAKAGRTHLQKQIQALSAVGPLDAVLKRAQSRTKGLQMLIDQSGLKTTVGILLLGSGTLALLGFVLVQHL